MADNKNNQPQGLQLELPQDVAQGQYSNLAIIQHSHTEFVLDFARVVPNVPKAQVKNRVIMVSEHAKRLLQALQENVARYESEYGRIEILNQPPRTATPFQIGKGDA